MQKYLNYALAGAVFATALAWMPVALKAYQPPPSYHDKEHNDDHVWNQAEDKAYRGWEESKHYTHREFNKLNAKRQQEYWKWRHDHPDHG